MKIYIKLLYITLFTLILAVSLQAKTINITDFGAIADDNIDDTNAVREAVEKIINFGGGTIIFPEGTTDISDTIKFVTHGNTQSYRLVGDGGSFVRLNGDSNTSYFIFGNSNQVKFDGLIFYAPANPVINADRVIFSSYVGKTIITDCSFFGIGAKTAIIDAHNTELTVDKSQFEGSAATQGVIHSLTAKGVSVSNTSFIDYANFLDMFLSKTPYMLTYAWVNIENVNPTFLGNGQRVARITDTRFDEGALKALRIKNQKSVHISGINVNVSGIDGGAGILLDAVQFAEVKFSAFGFSNAARPAVELINSSSIEATALTFSNAVYFMNSDSTSNAVVNYCPDCQIPARKALAK